MHGCVVATPLFFIPLPPNLTNCGNDEYEVRALLHWRLCRILILERLEFYFKANDTGVVPSEATRAQTATTAKKKIAHLISCLAKDVYATLKSLANLSARRTGATRRLPTFSKNTIKYKHRRQRQRSPFGHVNRSRQSGSLISVTD